MTSPRAWTCPTCGGRYDLTPVGGPGPVSGADGITENQIKAIHAIIGSDKNLEDRARAYAKSHFNAESTKDLKKKQASEFIDWLKAQDISF